MGMVVRSNIMALNANRQLGMNNSSVSKNLEKLSSGFRINRAGDDASGLAISEKMKAQIKGLETASMNSQDGISLVQTAEGALTEVHDMLNRMVELAEKSANGTMEIGEGYGEAGTDRQALQDEMDQLATEIERIGRSTNFNNIKLLDGTLGAGSSAVSNISKGAYVKAGDTSAISADVGNVREAAVTIQVNAEFTVSLDDFAFKSDGASTTSTVSLKVGDATITTAALTADQSASQLATALAGAGKDLDTTDTTNNTLGTGTGNHVKINGNIYEMTAAGDKITFKQVNEMAEGTDPVNPDFAVSVDSTLAGTDKVTGKVNPQVQVTTQGIAVGSTEQARVDITLNFKELQDGDTMKIGDKTYVFKIGEGSTTAADGSQVLIDLSTVFKTKEDMTDQDLQKQAMVEITKAMGGAGSTMWSVGNGGVKGSKGTLTLQSFSSYTDVPATGKMDTEENIMAQFEFTTPAKNAATSFSLDVTKIKEGDSIEVDGKIYEFTNGTNASKNGAIAVNLSALGIESSAGGISDKKTGDVIDALLTELNKAANNGGRFSAAANSDKNGVVITSQDVTGTADVNEAKTSIEVKSGSGLVLQIGDTNDSFNKMTVEIQSMKTDNLFSGDVLMDATNGNATTQELEDGSVTFDISSQDTAGTALTAIKKVINVVSSQRAALGAIQNRLEHTINNLDVAAENMNSANSRIRDTDMAKQMMEYTKMNVLTQAAQAMLAQANQQPQSILQLLQ